jgi:hypothetical protein
MITVDIVAVAITRFVQFEVEPKEAGRDVQVGAVEGRWQRSCQGATLLTLALALPIAPV